MFSSISGLGETGHYQKSSVERNSPVIRIFRNFKPISQGTPQIFRMRCLFDSFSHPHFLTKFEVFGEADETLSRVFDTYTLFDGLTHTDARIFCELRSILKIRAMRKMPARIIC